MQSDEKKTNFSTRVIKVCCIESPWMGPTPNFTVTPEKCEVGVGDLRFVYGDGVRPWARRFSVHSSVPLCYSTVVKL